jgi:7-cyano-7-deazaguanine synthase
MEGLQKKVIVVHSGGMDSSISLALAMREFGKEQVLSLSFSYGQRHTTELAQAAFICREWGVDHIELTVDCLKQITKNSLIGKSIPIQDGKPPNSLVVGRNGLLARLAAIHLHSLGGHYIYMGVMGLDGSHSGYRDCSRAYMDKMQEILRIDLDDPLFEIRTPMVNLTKKQTMELAEKLGILDFLIENTVSCYEGVRHPGCGQCPSCKLRNEGLKEFMASKA